MKNIFKDRINIINGILLLLLIAISVFIYIWLKGDRYFEKKVWHYTVNSKDTDLRHYRVLNIFLSSEDGGISGISEEQGSANNIIDIIKANNINDIDTLNLYNHHKYLLPDSLKMEWFSFEDNTFYQLKTKLPQRKLQEQSDLINGKIVLVNTILPNGSLSLGLSNEDILSQTNPYIIPITTFKAQKISRDWSVLKEFNAQMKDIDNKEEFLEFYVKKYNWGFTADIAGNVVMDAIFIDDYYSNAIENMKFNNKKILPQNNLLPNKYQVVWSEEGKRYRGYFDFDPKDLLLAINKLEAGGKTGSFNFAIVINRKENKFQTFLENDAGKINLKNISDNHYIEEE